MRVGIDLGTTNTVVSYIDENLEWHVLEFDNGRREDRRLLPSAVALKNGIPVVGAEALEHSITNPADFCISRKREMGQRCSSWIIGGMDFTPEVIAEYILLAVRDQLSRTFPYESEFNAFVTVPAGFTVQARYSTRDALKKAGFTADECCLTDEPVSAAVAYGPGLESDKLVLVVDIGGGTFDLTLLRTGMIGGGNAADRLYPIAVGSDLGYGYSLAGNDVDKKLFEDMVRAFHLSSGIDIPSDDLEMRASNSEVTSAAALIRSKILGLKKELYEKGSADVFIGGLIGGEDFEYSITAEKYKSIMASGTNNIPAGFNSCIENLFRGSDYSPGNVSHVLAVGGMAHEICLNELLVSKFGREKLIIPDDNLFLVSHGAAVCNSNQKIHITNIAYTSIGMLTDNGQNVLNIIKEGDTVENGRIFRQSRRITNPDAVALKVTVVEYKGEFDPKRYNVILEESLPLRHNNSREGILGSVMGKFRKNMLDFEFRFNEDKILSIFVKQSGGAVSELSLRMSGRKM